jgi:NAD+ diphosphatase
MSRHEILPDARRPSHSPNHFAGGAIDRASERRGDADWVASGLRHPEARVVPVWNARSLVTDTPSGGFDPVFLSVEAARSLEQSEGEWILLGLDDGVPVFAVEVGDGFAESAPCEALGTFHDLHRVGALIGQNEGSLLAYARAITTWSARHRYCGRCGHATSSEEAGHLRRCGDECCQEQHFPRTDPAIIVLVEDGDRCLLGRKKIWPEGVYSTLAGFVEPGESLSEAVIREVREESGIEVGEVRYRSSQPWPFPSSLMLGFHAVRTGGKLRVDEVELEDARWFHRDDFARRKEIGLRLPSDVSIARRLIREWLDKR